MAEDRTQANFKSIVGRREGVDTPDAATIRAEVEASSAYLRSFRARESANASHFSNELDLGVIAGLVHDVKRLWGMIGRSLAHLLWSVVAQEVRFIAGRTLVRYRAKHKKIIEDVHICIDYTQDAQEGAGLMAMSPPEINSSRRRCPAAKEGHGHAKLGSSELRVSVCSFGGANWAAELMGVSHQGLGERRAMIFEMLDLAYARRHVLRHGGAVPACVQIKSSTRLQCARMRMYPSITGGGYSEFVFGEWLRVRAIDRDSVVISTKVAGDGGNSSLACRYDVVLGRPFAPGEPVPKKAKLSKVQIIDACDASLKRLGVETIDLLETHWPSRYVPKFGETGARYNRALEHAFVSFEEQLDAMAELMAAGKIRAWGVSNETTLCDRRFETELAEACSPLHGDVGLVAYGVLCGGTLAGKYSFGRKPPGERATEHAGLPEPRTSAATLKAAEDDEELAKAHGMTVLQLSLAYAYSRPFLATAILGARDPPQLEAQLEALDHVAKITPELCRKIDRVHHVCPNPNYSDTHSQFYPV
ncbi:oxidoreductase [Aureococcus anophagefferens]|nr:oxidoreductase [Aureococcus anophagefferens]